MPQADEAVSVRPDFDPANHFTDDDRKRLFIRLKDTAERTPDSELIARHAQVARELAMNRRTDDRFWTKDLLRIEEAACRSVLNWRKEAASRGAPGLDRGWWMDLVELIRQRHDLVEVMDACGVFVPHTDRQKVFVHCFHHTERSPSLHIDAEQKVWMCFGCLIGGDVFTFLKMHQGLEFSDAVRWLADRYKIPFEPPAVEPTTHPVYGPTHGR